MCEPIDPFLSWLFKENEIGAANYRSSSLKRRLPASLRFLKTRSCEEAQRKLAQSRELLQPALSSVLVGVTEFFRDNKVFAELRTTVLPELLNEHKRLRILSVGCSDGRELYSVAILLKELERLNSATLLGIDCRADAINKARSGSYNSLELGGLSAQQLSQNFTRHGNEWHVSAALRSQIQWERSDVLSSFPAGPWHLILFRNFQIYLVDSAARNVWKQIDAHLALDGFAVTGKAERPPRDLGLCAIAPSILKKSRGGKL